MKIKRGDKVQIMAGKDKGVVAKVTHSFPQEGFVLVEGVNKKKSFAKQGKGRPGVVVDKETPIHVSNVMVVDGNTPSRVGYTITGGKKVRTAKKTGNKIE